MNEILNEIKEVLKMSPARFQKVYFRANIITPTTDTIKVNLTSTLEYFGDYVVPLNPNAAGPHLESDERLMEKWHATGIAVGVLEYYLDTKKFKYSTTMSIDSINEVTAEILINV
jgi:hypothetical protein